MGGRSLVIAACKVRRGWLQRVQHLDVGQSPKGGMALEFGKHYIHVIIGQDNECVETDQQLLKGPFLSIPSDILHKSDSLSDLS